MPTKTIYVSDDDLALYERAQKLAEGNLSAAVARALRRFVEVEGGREEGYQEVTVRVGTGRARRAQRFSGLLLGEWRHPSSRRRIEVFRVYRTQKGNFVLHLRRMPDWAAWADPATWSQDWDFHGADWREWAGKGCSWVPSEPSLEVVSSLEELRGKVPPELFDTLCGAVDAPSVEELDI
ncbi:MAG: EXLDI protein [Acidimicrobiales bacterium]